MSIRNANERSEWRDVAWVASTSLRDIVTFLKGLYMSKLVDKLVASLVTLVLPRLLAELVKAVEELVKADLNNDGVIGFGGESRG